ncbi:MAG TPA: HDIG domain-containing protein [Anaerolineae bacterium]|nr:HDIG domain-containing protein [Anaerolineae bacterium]
MTVSFSRTSIARRPWRNWRFWALGVLFTIGTAAILIVPLLTLDQVALQVGDVASRDIKAARNLSYVSEIETELARDEAERRVAPVYTPPDAGVSRRQVARARQILDFIRAVRADTVTPSEQRRSMLQDVPDLELSTAQIDTILALPDGTWETIAPETITVVDLAMREAIRDLDLAEKRARLPALVSIALSEEQAALVSALAQGLIIPNSLRDEAATTQRRADARNTVEPKQVSFIAGQNVVREGALVTPAMLEALEHLGLATPRVDWGDILGLALLSLIVAAVLGLYLWRYEPELSQHPRRLLLLILLLFSFLLAAKLIVPGRAVLPYVFPAAALAMLLTVLLGPGLALTASAVLAALIGVMVDGSLEFAAYFGAGSITAALALGRVERLNAFFWAGLYVGAINIVTILAFRLPAGDLDSIGFVTLILAALANGALSASITLGGLFTFGSLFDLATTVQLLELARPTHPLLNELMRKAPGTYHHTLMVASLAEQAAVQIGANALLTRVGAFYHDIGKAARPYMFVENQVDGSNVHDQFDPQTSAEIIVSHVTDGLQLARKHRLPSRIRAFIPEHHGTMRAGFLYRKALESVGGDASKLNESSFRYPGPKPRSKETALLMLADSAEAAVRAARPSSPEQVAEIVKKVIDERIAQGQLDECPLTLNDLRLARESFITTLQGVFHPRLQYPDTTKLDDGQIKSIAPEAEVRERLTDGRSRQARAD